MHITRATSLLFFTAVNAAYAAVGDASSSTSVAASTTTSTNPSDPTHTIQVGASGLTFTPDNITADVGTKLEFHFYPKNHSVAQSSFAAPCEPNTNGTSFFSGALPTTSGENENVFTVTVNSTSPIWFYCGAPTHCEQGMVGAVNLPADGSKTLEQFKTAAKQVSATKNLAAAQGGILGPVSKDSNSTSTTAGSSSATGSGSGSTSTSNSGADGKRVVSWMGVGGVAAGAVGVGYLLGM